MRTFIKLILKTFVILASIIFSYVFADEQINSDIRVNIEKYISEKNMQLIENKNDHSLSASYLQQVCKYTAPKYRDLITNPDMELLKNITALLRDDNDDARTCAVTLIARMGCSAKSTLPVLKIEVENQRAKEKLQGNQNLMGGISRSILMDNTISKLEKCSDALKK